MISQIVANVSPELPYVVGIFLACAAVALVLPACQWLTGRIWGGK